MYVHVVRVVYEEREMMSRTENSINTACLRAIDRSENMRQVKGVAAGDGGEKCLSRVKYF